MSSKFFIAMLTAFLDLVIPDSTNVKPACIKNTKIPAISIQSIPMSPFICSTASATPAAAVSCINVRNKLIFIFFN